MSNSCYLAEDATVDKVMKIEEFFSSGDSAQKESNPAKKPRLAVSDTTQNGASGQAFTDGKDHQPVDNEKKTSGTISPRIPNSGAETNSPSNQESSIELIRLDASDGDDENVVGDGDFFVENVVTVKEEAAVSEAKNGYFDRFVQKNVSEKTKSYLRNQLGSIKL